MKTIPADVANKNATTVIVSRSNNVPTHEHTPLFFPAAGYFFEIRGKYAPFSPPKLFL